MALLTQEVRKAMQDGIAQERIDLVIVEPAIELAKRQAERQFFSQERLLVPLIVAQRLARETAAGEDGANRLRAQPGG
jgi:hypothetical protein